MLNAGKLYEELKTVGIAVQSTDSNGIVLDVNGNQIQNRADVAAIIAAHNPTTPAWIDIRTQRDALLGKSDWTQLADAVLTIEEKAAWSDYRQALRDLPQTYDKPEDVIFPTLPGGA